MGKGQPRGDERGRQKRDKRRVVGSTSARCESIRKNFKPQNGRHSSQ